MVDGRFGFISGKQPRYGFATDSPSLVVPVRSSVSGYFLNRNHNRVLRAYTQFIFSHLGREHAEVLVPHMLMGPGFIN
jgi:hypothetical protein